MNTQQQINNDLAPGDTVMADNSLESLLRWLKEPSRMSGWDLIVALDGRKINIGLQLDHINRLSADNDLGVIAGSVDIPDTNLTHILSGFRLAAPMLTFDKATLETPKTALSLAVVGGIQTLVENKNGQKRILSLTALDPADGSHLTLDVPLVGRETEVSLDLINSENVLLTLFRTPNEQRVAGKLFKAWFNGLDNKKRVFALGSLPDKGNPSMLTRRIDVRTQRRDVPALPADVVDENGAVLLFARLEDGGSGNFPGDDSGFRYLIPDNDAQNSYSTTQLFSRALTHRAAFRPAALHLLDDADFEHFFDREGALEKMVASRGVMKVAAGKYKGSEYEFESEAFNLPAAGGALPLTVEFTPHQVSQRWQNSVTLPFRYRLLGSTSWTPDTAVFNFNLLHEFRLWAEESGAWAMEGELSTPYTHKEVSVESGLAAIAPEKLEHIKDFAGNTFKRALLDSFSYTLTKAASEGFFQEVDIVGGSELQASRGALPSDQVLFGKINAAGASFSIVQQQPLVAASKPLQFTTEPVRDGLLWRLESLPGSEDDPGQIGEHTGLYRAPPAHAMTGAFSRVLVIATDSTTHERSVTLATVQASPITINPQIQLCYHGQKVELSAGQLDGTPLSWSIKNPVAGQSGDLVESTEPGGDHAYIAHSQVPGETYVLDEVEVKDSQGIETASAYVLAIQKDSLIAVKPVEGTGLPEGQIQLQAFFDGDPVDGNWSLPLGGPGTVDETGIYTDDLNAKERFVLIFVSVAEIGHTFEGHLILPLPLADATAVIKALAE